MTVYIARHELRRPNPEQYAERFNEYLIKSIDELEESSAVIDGTFGSAVMNLRARCLVDPRAGAVETWEAAVNAMQMGSALFAATAINEGTVECRINRKLRSIPAAGSLPTANAGAWLSAFWLAVICREPDRMTQLCEIPVERLRVTEGRVDEYIYLWVDTLQTYWLRRPGLVEKLTATIDASYPSVARVAPQDLLNHILYPPINLFYRFVTRDVERFSPALEETLNLHRAYWTATEDRQTDIDGALPLAPLAIACWAYDGELPINVESEYLPKHLLNHGWLGEFPT